jgi:hypothetical protein
MCSPFRRALRSLKGLLSRKATLKIDIRSALLLFDWPGRS